MDVTSDLEKAQPALPWWKCWQLWPRKRLYLWLAAGFVSLSLVGLIIGLAVHFGIRRAAAPGKPITQTGVHPSDTTNINGAVVATNFADPSYITENNTHYAFATNRYKINRPGQIHIQLATSTDFQSWELTNFDALPYAGPWTTNAFVWAPDVVKLDNGKFLMYYTAQVPDHLHCIGVAMSDNVTGPYTPQSQPIVCPTDLGGAIDPEGFQDVDGTRYLVYKVDGNSFDNGRNKTHSTPIMLQRVASDGFTLEGPPVQILDRTAADGPLVEAPALGRYERPGQSALYVLFYSSQFFSGPGYDVKYATSDNVHGPYVRAKKALLKTGDGPEGALIGPGGMDVGASSTQVVFHAIQKGTMGRNATLSRPMWTGQFTIEGTTLSI